MSTRLQATLEAFDQANRADPNIETVDGEDQPKELVYGQRMSQTLAEFSPQASEALQLAARAQHIKRWEIPRNQYPMDRPGYKKWRTQLGVYHGQVASEIMAEQGYDQETIERVQSMLSKRNLKRDPDVQTLEDVICLVFLQHYLEDFARKHPEPKLIDIIQKTWRKMSPEGHAAALKLKLPSHLQTLVGKALS